MLTRPLFTGISSAVLLLPALLIAQDTPKKRSLPVAKVNAWVVEAEMAGQKFKHWVDKSTHEIVKTSFSPAPGVELRTMK